MRSFIPSFIVSSWAIVTVLTLSACQPATQAGLSTAFEARVPVVGEVLYSSR